MAKKYWLMKSEPEVFSIDDLKRVKRETWDGVRNYQARNFMQKDMQIGDAILFYHSNCKLPGIYGLAQVSRLAFPDPSQFQKDSPYYDAKAVADKPRWYCVEVEYVAHFDEPVSLEKLRQQTELSSMKLLQKGQRLSVQPVEGGHYRKILKLAGFS